MNLLFINSSLISLQEFINSCNVNTKYILYSVNDTFDSLTEKINDLGISSFQHVGFVFEDRGVDGIFESFVENNVFISIDENNEITENTTSEFIKTIVNLYNVKYLDFLACNLLNYQYWKLFFEYLQNQTYESLVVRASDNLSGNLQNGGDWILETTYEDITKVYFNENINNWNYLLGIQVEMNAILTNEEIDNVYTSGLPIPDYKSLRKYNNYVNTECIFEKNIISCVSQLDLIAFLTDEPSNNLYVFGKNVYGSLGLGSSILSTSEITNVTTNIENKKILAVHISGLMGSKSPLYILTDEPVNNLYVTGWGLSGLGVSTRSYTFERVTSLNQKILMISGTITKVVLITDEPSNNVYYLDSTTNQLFVNLNDATLIDKKAIFIDANETHSAILTDEPINNLYTLGVGTVGQLGLGVIQEVNVYTNVSSYSNELLNKHIVGVYMDEFYSRSTFVLTDEDSNNLYATGDAIGNGTGIGTLVRNFRNVSNFSTELSNKKVVYLSQTKNGIFLLTSEPTNNLYATGMLNSTLSVIGIPPYPNNANSTVQFINISNNDSILSNHLINKQVKLVTGGDYWSLVITNENPTLNSNLYISGLFNNNFSKTFTKSFVRFKQIDPPTYKKFVKIMITRHGIYLISTEINNNLYFCGFSSPVGSFTSLTNISLMQPNLLGKKILNVSANNANNKVYVITSEASNNLYGCSTRSAEFIGGTYIPYTFINITTNIENKKVIKIGCTDKCNALLTDEQSDNYYVCGNKINGGAYGDGLATSPDYQFFTNIITPEISGKKFINLELGQNGATTYRTYLISDEITNNLYFCGSFESYNSGDPVNALTIVNVNNTNPNILNKRVVKVSCGINQSAIITDEIVSNLYMIGEGIGNGFLGTKTTKYSIPNSDLIQSKRIIDVICQSNCTTVVTNDISNNIYLFGTNTNGQLGINNISDTGVPTLPYNLNRTKLVYVDNSLLKENNYRIINATNQDNSNNAIDVKYKPRNINIGQNNITYFPDFTKNEIVISSLPISNVIDSYQSSLTLSSNKLVSGYIKLEPPGTRFETHISMDFDVEPNNNPSLYFKSSNDLTPQLIPSTNTSDNDVYYTYNSSIGTITLYTKHFSEAIVVQDQETGTGETGTGETGTGETGTGETGTGETGTGETGTGETGTGETGTGETGTISNTIDFNLDYLNAIISMDVKGDIFKSGANIIRDAIADYYVNINDMKKVFAFQTDSDDIDSINDTDIKYFVRTSQWPNELILNPCNAWVNSLQQIATNDRQGVISDDRELVKHDFIRYIAKSLFNTHLAVDLFQNESELNYDLSYKGVAVWDNILNSLTEIGDVSLNTTLYNGLYGVDISYGYYLTNDASSNTNISRELLGIISNYAPSRLQNLNNYSIDVNKGLFSIPLIAGDILSFKLTLQPASNQHTIVNRETPIPSRTYQIRINLRESVSKSNVHGDGVNVIVNDTIPSLYNNMPVTESLNNSFPSNYQDLLVNIYSGYYDGNTSFFNEAPILYANSTNDLTSISTITLNSFNNFNSSQERSVKVSGFFRANKTGTYRFFTYSNDKNILEIDGDNIIVNNDLKQNSFSDKYLIAGNDYSFNLYYGNRVFKYPPSAMNDNTIDIQNQSYGNGIYNVSASYSNATIALGETFPFYAFDNSGSTVWRRMYYSTRETNTNEGVVLGEWIQIQLPVQIVLDILSITPELTQTTRPRNIALLGRNDPSSLWNVIYRNTNLGLVGNDANLYRVNANESYSYYRFVIITNQGAEHTDIKEIALYEKSNISAGYLEPNDDGTNAGSTDPNDFIHKI